MIKNTFLLLEGISYKKEQNIWQQGINDWNDFLSRDKVIGISKKRKQTYNSKINEIHSALLKEDYQELSKLIPKKDHWRLYPYLKDECVFLDIETSSVNGYITCMTFYDGINTMTLVKNQNLYPDNIRRILSKFKMIVTFNGNVFDLPFLKKYYNNIIPEMPCWDLRHSCHGIGLKGGLKEIEKELGIKRQNEIVERIKGGDPITLWRTFLATGDAYYLELLVEYNQEDAINLKSIADKTYTRICEKKIT
jgi:uncharacterized protein YprB with RNaseH-like and TPR domain